VSNHAALRRKKSDANKCDKVPPKPRGFDVRQFFLNQRRKE